MGVGRLFLPRTYCFKLTPYLAVNFAFWVVYRLAVEENPLVMLVVGEYILN
jgi:hypothetical protein